MTDHIPAADRRTSPTSEVERWRRQLETLEAVAGFIKAHAPGEADALPVVPWEISAADGAVARLGSSMCDADGVPVDLRAVVAAYAAALGSEMASADLGTGMTGYKVKGAIGDRDRVELALFAIVRDIVA